MARRLQFVAVGLSAWLSVVAAMGQQAGHYFHSANLPPGTVGQGQLEQFAALRGYFQPIQISVPEGARLSLLADGHFNPPRTGPLTAGMQVGSVYHLKVTQIPFHAGDEVFPTIEVINRLYPPHGQQLRFPVPVQITQNELELALSGRFVTRVIYLEDTETALPHADDPSHQRYFEVSPGQDPLRAADQLGRPMAILRMGSRVPQVGIDPTGGSGGHPPLMLYTPEQLNRPEAGTQSAIERQGQNIPRIPLFERTAERTLPAGQLDR